MSVSRKKLTGEEIRGMLAHAMQEAEGEVFTLAGARRALMEVYFDDKAVADALAGLERQGELTREKRGKFALAAQATAGGASDPVTAMIEQILDSPFGAGGLTLEGLAKEVRLRTKKSYSDRTVERKAGVMDSVKLGRDGLYRWKSDADAADRIAGSTRDEAGRDGSRRK